MDDPLTNNLIIVWEEVATIFSEFKYILSDGTELIIKFDWSDVLKTIHLYPKYHLSGEQFIYLSEPERKELEKFYKTNPNWNDAILTFYYDKEVDLNIFDIEAILYELFLLINLSSPGSFDLFNTKLDDKYTLELCCLHFETSYFQFFEMGWPDFNIPNGPMAQENNTYSAYNTENISFNPTFGNVFPTFISNYFDPNYKSQVQHSIINAPIRSCVKDSIPFSLDLTNYITEYHWDFGDGDTSILKEPKHTYDNPGIYTIQLIIKYSCLYDTIYQSIAIDNRKLSAKGDTTTYTCQFTTFKAGKDFISYKWSTGDTSTTITTNNPGLYTVSQTDGCGSQESQFRLIQPQTELYNLITANEDGKNDVLTFAEYPIPSTLKIFDRWGALIYSNEDYKNNFDATYLADGLYYYLFNYEGCPEAKSWVQVVK